MKILIINRAFISKCKKWIIIKVVWSSETLNNLECNVFVNSVDFRGWYIQFICLFMYKNRTESILLVRASNETTMANKSSPSIAKVSSHKIRHRSIYSDCFVEWISKRPRTTNAYTLLNGSKTMAQKAHLPLHRRQTSSMGVSNEQLHFHFLRKSGRFMWNNIC